MLTKYLTGIVYIVLAAYFLIPAPEQEVLEIIVLFVGAAQLGRLALTRQVDSLTAVTAIAGIFLFLLPSIAITLIYQRDVVYLLAFYIFLSDLFRIATYRLQTKMGGNDVVANKIPINNYYVYLYLTLLWIVCFVFVPSGNEFFNLFYFYVPYGLSLILFEKVIATQPRASRFAFILIAYFIIVGLYVTFKWGGYGRLVIGAFVLMPLLLVNHYRDFGLRLWKIIILSPFALLIAAIPRYGNLVYYEDVFIGSAGHHLLVADDIFRLFGKKNHGEWHQFLDQYILLAFNWIPRDFWSDKPVGIGLTSVETIYGREGVDESYSHSVGFVGEQFFVLGDWFLVGLAIVLGTLVLLRYLLSRLSRGMVSLLIIFDVNLISYFWGGGATFGSRIWFMLLPVALLVLFFRSSKLAPNKITRAY